MIIGLVSQARYSLHALVRPVGFINSSISICCGRNSAIYFIHKVELTGFAGYYIFRKGGIITFIFQVSPFRIKVLHVSSAGSPIIFSASIMVRSFGAMATESA